MTPCLTMYEIELVAAALHASWYAYAVLAKGEAGEPWATAPEWQKASCRDAARFHFDLYIRGVPSSEWPELSHKNWLAFKAADGWIYGPTKDAEKKTHPCMVAYAALPESQRAKDDVAVQASIAMFVAIGK
jgi:hypothetical protein